MATHSSTVAWKIPWMEERGGLQTMGSQRVSLMTHTHVMHKIFHTECLNSKLQWCVEAKDLSR